MYLRFHGREEGELASPSKTWISICRGEEIDPHASKLAWKITKSSAGKSESSTAYSLQISHCVLTRWAPRKSRKCLVVWSDIFPISFYHSYSGVNHPKRSCNYIICIYYIGPHAHLEAETNTRGLVCSVDCFLVCLSRACLGKWMTELFQLGQKVTLIEKRIILRIA